MSSIPASNGTPTASLRKNQYIQQRRGFGGLQTSARSRRQQAATAQQAIAINLAGKWKYLSGIGTVDPAKLPFFACFGTQNTVTGNDMKNRFRLLLGAPLLLGVGACSLLNPPKDLDIRSTRSSIGGMYVVSMHPVAEPVKVNKIHSWEIKVTAASGEPVKKAQIAFDGGMPQHCHSFPTKPRVTEELGDGRYRLDGVKFSMTGWWEMKAKIHSELGSDQATVNVVMTESGIATPQQAK